MQITLGEILDKAVYFAKWCREYQASPTLVGEAISLYKELRSKRMGWDKSEEYRLAIQGRLSISGFTNIQFSGGDILSFDHKVTGDVSIKLPEI